MTELPKWPILLVKGERITPEQADKVIIRTTWVDGMSCWDNQWDRYAKKAFGITESGPLHKVSDAGWREVRKRLGILDLNYIFNDRIVSHYTCGPHGWCNWNGDIGTAGMSLLSKWPKVEDVHGEWVKIAHAFPFLTLTAQLVRLEWDFDEPEITGYTPLVTWLVGQGGVQMLDQPGELLRPVSDDEDEAAAIARIRRPAGDTGVRIKRLTEAVRRCERAAEKGK